MLGLLVLLIIVCLAWAISDSGSVDSTHASLMAREASLWIDAAEGKFTHDQCLTYARRRIRDSLLFNPNPDPETIKVMDRLAQALEDGK